jgi:hypothetical protein
MFQFFKKNPVKPKAVTESKKVGNDASLQKAPKLKKLATRGYKPADNRQVTHNLRRRMGR